MAARAIFLVACVIGAHLIMLHLLGHLAFSPEDFPSNYSPARYSREVSLFGAKCCQHAAYVGVGCALRRGGAVVNAATGASLIDDRL